MRLALPVSACLHADTHTCWYADKPLGRLHARSRGASDRSRGRLRQACWLLLCMVPLAAHGLVLSGTVDMAPMTCIRLCLLPQAACAEVRRDKPAGCFDMEMASSSLLSVQPLNGGQS